MNRHTRETLRAELERRGCTPHPNPHAVVVPLGEVWIHPDGVTRIIIPRPDDDGTYSPFIIQNLFAIHDLPPPRPVN